MQNFKYKTKLSRIFKKSKLLLRSIVFILIFALLFTSLPTEAFNFPAKAEDEEIYVVKEVEDYRTQNSKTFLKSDGSMTGIVSSEALHFKDDDEWKEIDNTLTQTENGYKNTAGELNITLPDELDKTGAVTVSNSEYSISFSPAGIIKSASGKVKNTSKKADKSKYKDMTPAEITEKTPTSGSMTYSGVYEDSDIRYDVQSNKLKESIILDKKPNKHLKYTYTVTTKGLSAELIEGNVIEFFTGEDKTREVVFTMPAPLMFDSDNVTSYDISVALEKEADGVYTLTYTPNTDWLRSKERIYPVTIDPTVEYTPSASATQVACVTDYNNYVNDRHYLRVGGYYDDFLGFIGYESYLHIPEITNLPSGSIILNAQLKVFAKSASSEFSGKNIAIKQVLSEWYTTQDYDFSHPTLDNRISDWASVSSDDIGNYISFDVTSLYRRSWNNGYEWGGYGVKFVDLSGDPFSYVTLEGKSPDYSSDPHPAYIELDIVNQNGYANNSKSRTIDLESAGIAYINDFTGHLSLIRDDIGYGGNVMPVDFKMIYNNYEHDEINMGFGDIAAYGKGWRSNYSQKIKYIDTGVSNPYYEYITADGSVTYFEKVLEDTEITTETDRSTIFADTTNGAYTICVGTDYDDYTSLYIKGDINQKYYFDSFGRLIKIAGNMEKTDNITSTSGGTTAEPGVIRIFYVSNANANAMAISHIYDGAGRKYNFVYKPNEYRLWVIQYMGTGSTSLASVTYEYNDDNTVYRVCQSDGRNIYYTWDNGVMTETKSYDGRRCTFGYHRDLLGNFVNEIKLYGADGTLGQSISAVRDTNSVVYTDNNTGKTETIYFDYNGNPVNMNVITSNSEGEMTVAYYEKPNLGSPTSQLVSYTDVQNTVYNYIKDGYGATTLNSWNAIPENSIALSSDYAKFGSQSFKLNDNAETLYQDINLAETGTYTLSAYAKANDGGIASLSVSGISGVVDNIIDSAASTSSTSDNQRICYTFDVTTAGTVRVCLNRSGTASVYFDGIQLEKGDIAHKVNLVADSGFDNNWLYWRHNGYIDSISIQSETKNETVNKYLRITSECDEKIVYQSLPVAGSEGDTYTFGGWIKKPYATSPRDYDIKAQFYNGDTAVGEEANIVLRPGNNGWIYMISKITADAPYTSLKITLCYNYGFNEVNFDDIQVYYDNVETSYDYNNNGELSGIIETPENNSTVDDSNTEVTEGDETVDSETITPISYDSHGRIIKTEDKSKAKNHLQYDEYSNPTAEYVTDGNLKIKKHSKFSANGNIKTEEWNEVGAKTTYNVDANFNLTNSVMNAANVTTTQTYDNYKRLKSTSVPVTGLSSGTALTNNYTYDVENRLKSINNYNINYDTFGRLNNIKVGSTNLLTYNYNTFANGGNLSNIIFANGQQYIYNYDAKGRLKYITNGTKEIYKNIYGPNGKVVMVQYDHSNSSTISSNKSYIKYTTDSTGNDVVKTYDNYIESVEQSYTSLYDKFVEIVNNKSYTTNYTFTANGSNAGANWQHNQVTHNHQITYDDLGRIQTKSFSNTSGETTTNALTKSYSYTNLDAPYTTSRVTSINYQANNYTKALNYTYTATGLISSAGEVSYEYNEAGMLTRVNDPNNGTIVYIYNENGALHYVKYYAYTVGELGICLKTKTYAYDSVWKDKPVSSNIAATGEEVEPWDYFNISYDASGNPTSYGTAFEGFSFSWMNGRQLKKLEFASVMDETQNYSLDFAYNPQGLRTVKYYEYMPNAGSPTQATVKFTYDSNGKLTSQQGNQYDTFYFYYDKDGNLLACEYMGAIYYYVTNLQGDVIAIIDSNGNCVVEYTYDAWGKVLSRTGSMANTLGSHNPLRYRGYYYDRESGFYYLKSRYYDPNTGKFLNADSVSMLASGEKAYTYCENNPINFYDLYGTSPRYEDYKVYVGGWDDTILHLGLSPDGFSLNDFFIAVSYGLSPVYNFKCTDESYYSLALLGQDINKAVYDAHNKFSFNLLFIKPIYYTLIQKPVSVKYEVFERYNYNLGIQEGTAIGTDFIYCQDSLDKWKYGTSDIPTSGCGAVAFYNAMILLGRKVDFSAIVAMFDFYGLVWGEEFGTVFWAIEKMAKTFGLNYQDTDLFPETIYAESMVSLLLRNGKTVAIVLNNNKKGDLFGLKHYYTLSSNFNDNGDSIKDETEKKYISYNRYSGFSEPKYYDSLRESLDDGEIYKIYFLSER